MESCEKSSNVSKSEEEEKGTHIPKENEKNRSQKKRRNKQLARTFRVIYRDNQYVNKRQSKGSFSTDNQSSENSSGGKASKKDNRSTSSEYRVQKKPVLATTDEELNNKLRVSSNDASVSAKANKPVKSKNVSGNIKQQSKVLNPNKKASDEDNFNDISTSEKTKSVMKGKRIREKIPAENKKMLSNIIACISQMEEKLLKYETDGTADEQVNSADKTGKGKSKKSKKKKEKKKKDEIRKTGQQNDESEEDKIKIGEQKKTKKKNASPAHHFHATHFLTFRVYNSDIQSKAAVIQENVFNVNKDFKPTFVELPNLHVTLAVISVKNEEVGKIYKILDSSLSRLNDIYCKATCRSVEFDSLFTFDKGDVVYMAVKDTKGSEMLCSLVSVLRDCFSQQGIPMERDTFTPHATIMKIKNRLSLRKKGVRKIPSDMYAAYKDDWFGTEEVFEVLLCAMAGKKAGEFHKVLASIDLPANKLTVFDSGPKVPKVDVGSMSLVSENVTEEEQLNKVINLIIDGIIDYTDIMDNITGSL